MVSITKSSETRLVHTTLRGGGGVTKMQTVPDPVSYLYIQAKHYRVICVFVHHVFILILSSIKALSTVNFI